ncbi:unnamed protein product [Moneuplotes crassus]|uniref:Uncharacterized protein n=1 Tax=Euplotes crassus TaxID=5936 RepID=A0AAD1Y3E3_EUPCR|nr:unnamed protein product [Moneuplotes crassus]
MHLRDSIVLFMLSRFIKLYFLPSQNARNLVIAISKIIRLCFKLLLLSYLPHQYLQMDQFRLKACGNFHLMFCIILINSSSRSAVRVCSLFHHYDEYLERFSLWFYTKFLLKLRGSEPPDLSLICT